MRTLTYYVAVSLDGRIAAADGDYSAFPVQGAHIEALVRDFPETFPAAARAALGIDAPARRFDTVLMGWNTYAVGLPFGLVDPYPSLRTIVFSRAADARAAQATAAASEHGAPAPAAVTFTDEEPLAVVRRLEAEPDADAATAESSADGIWLCGGGSLAGALLPEIDRLVLKVNPVLLGDTGIPLVAGGLGALPEAFRHVSGTAYDSGVVVNEYERGA